MEDITSSEEKQREFKKGQKHRKQWRWREMGGAREAGKRGREGDGRAKQGNKKKDHWRKGERSGGSWSRWNAALRDKGKRGWIRGREKASGWRDPILYETIHSSGQSFWYACNSSVLMRSSLSQLHCLSTSFHKEKKKWWIQIAKTLSLKWPTESSKD